MAIFVRAHGSYDVVHSRCSYDIYAPYFFIPKQLAEIECEIAEEWVAYQKVWQSGTPDRVALKSFIKKLGLLRNRLVVHLNALNVNFEGIRHDANYKFNLNKIKNLSSILHQLILITVAMNDINETKKSQNYLDYKNGDCNLNSLIKLYNHLISLKTEFIAFTVKLNKLEISETIHSTLIEKVITTINVIDSELLILQSTIIQKATLRTKDVQIEKKGTSAHEPAMSVINNTQP